MRCPIILNPEVTTLVYSISVVASQDRLFSFTAGVDPVHSRSSSVTHVEYVRWRDGYWQKRLRANADSTFATDPPHSRGRLKSP